MSMKLLACICVIWWLLPSQIVGFSLTSSQAHRYLHQGRRSTALHARIFLSALDDTEPDIRSSDGIAGVEFSLR